METRIQYAQLKLSTLKDNGVLRSEILSCWRAVASGRCQDCPLKTVGEGDPVMDRKREGDHSGTEKRGSKKASSFARLGMERRVKG